MVLYSGLLFHIDWQKIHDASKYHLAFILSFEEYANETRSSLTSERSDRFWGSPSLLKNGTGDEVAGVCVGV
jgi:hypothetical protein